MKRKLNICPSAIFGEATWFDLLLVPAVVMLSMLVFFSIITTFLTTQMPSPTLPTIVNTAIGFSRVSKNYLEMAQLLLGQYLAIV
jgi:uncharacterized membrane-anchored protein